MLKKGQGRAVRRRAVGCNIVSINNNLQNVCNTNILSHYLRRSLHFSLYVNISTNDTGVTSCLTNRRKQGGPFCSRCSFHVRCVDIHGLVHGRSCLSLNCICNALDGTNNRGPLSCTTLTHDPTRLYIITTGTRGNRTRCFAGTSLRPSSCHILVTSYYVPIVSRPYIVSNIPCFSNNLTSPIPLR